MSTTAHPAPHADIGKVLLSDDKDGLVDLQAQDFGTQELDGLRVDLDGTTAIANEGDSCGSLKGKRLGSLLSATDVNRCPYLLLAKALDANGDVLLGTGASAALGGRPRVGGLGHCGAGLVDDGAALRLVRRHGLGELAPAGLDAPVDLFVRGHRY